MGWADYLSRSPSGGAPPISTCDASFSVPVCRQIRAVFARCFDLAHKCTRQPANPNARAHCFVHLSSHADTRVSLLSLQSVHSCSLWRSVYTRSFCSHLQMPSPLRNFFSWRSPTTNSPPPPDSSTPTTSVDPPEAPSQSSPASPVPALHLSVATQVDFSLPDQHELSVAVLQAVDELRPRTSEAAVMTDPSRVGDHFSPELIRSLTAADAELSGIIELLSTPRPESEKNKRRAKLNKAWLSVFPSLHTNNGLLFIDERLILPHCLRTPVLQLLHSTHAGARAMMSMAEFVWSPNMIREIHFVTGSCPACTSTGKNLSTPCSRANSAPRAPVSRPFEELELDF